MNSFQLECLRDLIKAEIREALAAERPVHNKMAEISEWQTSDYAYECLLDSMGLDQSE